MSRHSAATEGLALRCPCAMCCLSSSPTCVDATQQYRGKPTKSKDCGIMGFGFCLGFFWWFFFSKVSERRRAGELTQRKSFLGEEPEGGQGRTLSLCWFSYLTPVTLTDGFITSGLWMGCRTKDVESLFFWELVGTTTEINMDISSKDYTPLQLFSVCVCCLQNVELASKINSSQRGFNRVCCFPEEIDCKQTVSCSYLK